MMELSTADPPTEQFWWLTNGVWVFMDTGPSPQVKVHSQFTRPADGCVVEK